MGVREIDLSLEQWRMGVKDLRRRMILAPTPRERALRQAQEVVRHPAAGSGLDGSGDGGGAGAGPPYHRTLGVGLRWGRACGPDIRADRWFPPALDQAQQEELKGAVEQRPAAAGGPKWDVICNLVGFSEGAGRCGSSFRLDSLRNPVWPPWFPGTSPSLCLIAIEVRAVAWQVHQPQAQARYPQVLPHGFTTALSQITCNPHSAAPSVVSGRQPRFRRCCCPPGPSTPPRVSKHTAE